MRTQLVLNAMRDYYARNSILPSYSEIMSMTAIKSKNTVHTEISKLMEDGIFEKTTSKKLKPTQKFFGQSLYAKQFPAPKQEDK